MFSTRLILYFREDRLSYFEGDFLPTEFQEEIHGPETVQVNICF